MLNCDRCKKPTDTWKMSYFNTEKLCPACQAKEREHPMYGAAKTAEQEAVARGDYNFPGIGKPDDL